MKPSLFTIFFLTTAFVIFGCKGEKGDAGPAGPTGPQGTTSSPNVKTFKFFVASNQWINAGTNAVYYDDSTALITPNVNDSGTVLLFYRLPNNAWVSLPNSFVNSSSQPYGVNFGYTEGAVEVIMGSSVLSNSELRMNLTFKAIVIDGTVSLAKIDTRNYQELSRAFHLEKE